MESPPSLSKNTMFLCTSSLALRPPTIRTCSCASSFGQGVGIATFFLAPMAGADALADVLDNVLDDVPFADSAVAP